MVGEREKFLQREAHEKRQCEGYHRCGEIPEPKDLDKEREKREIHDCCGAAGEEVAEGAGKASNRCVDYIRNAIARGD